jgi:hypothetical protein
MSTRSFSIAVAALVAAALALSACGSGDSQSKVPSNAVAVVDGTPITDDEFDVVYKSTVAPYKAQGRTVPKKGTPEYSILRNQVLESLVLRLVAEKKAKEDFGIAVTDAQVDAELRRFKERAFGGSEERYQKRIAAQGLTDAEVRASIKAEMVSARVAERLARKIKVTDAEIGAYYQAHRERFPGKSLAQARPEIESLLLDEKRNQAFGDWTRRARREFRSKIRYAKGFSAPPSASA